MSDKEKIKALIKEAGKNKGFNKRSGALSKTGPLGRI